MKKAAFRIRPMQLSDLGDALKISSVEGWNQTERDWKLFVENPQNSCLVAERGKTVMGTVSAMNYSNEVAWIGMVLVDKAYRGQGVSKSLLEEIFKKVESCKSVKLDATPAGESVYRKFGFEDEYLIVRMANASMKILPGGDDDQLPVPIHENHIPEIVAFDSLIFGANRAALIEFLVRGCPKKAWLMKLNNSITGFALGRKGNKYHQIGPVFASTTADAKVLITKALRELTNLPVVVDVLCDKEDLINWLNSIGFSSQRHFVRMFKKENPFPGVIGKQHLICGPEFG